MDNKQKGPRVGDFMREFKPTSLAARAAADDAENARGRRRRNVTRDARTGGVRQSSDAPAAWRRWQHSSDDGAADSTSMTGYCMYTDDGPSSSSTRVQDERRRQRVERRSCKLLSCVSRMTRKRQATDGQVGQAS